MPLRLAFDLDGVFADLNGALAQEAAALLGKPRAVDHDTEPWSSRFALTNTEQEHVWRRVLARENFWEELQEIEPGSVARLWELARAKRWEIIFLTQRYDTRGASSQVQSQRWLQQHGFLLPSVSVVSRSRGKVAAALQLDILVDDHHEHCLDVLVESQARPILIWRKPEAAVSVSARRLGITVVDSVCACLDMLDEVDTSSADHPSMMEKLKERLGGRAPRRDLADLDD